MVSDMKAIGRMADSMEKVCMRVLCYYYVFICVVYKQGIYWWPDGKRYDGEWEDGMRTGGLLFFYFLDGKSFCCFINLFCLGQGVMYMANGERYNGTWLRNNMHGTAWWRLTNGKVR